MRNQKRKKRVSGRSTPMRKARKKKGLTLMDVAKVLKVVPQFISKMERGLVPVPEKRIAKLAVTLGLKPSEFIVQA